MSNYLNRQTIIDRLMALAKQRGAEKITYYHLVDLDLVQVTIQVQVPEQEFPQTPRHRTDYVFFLYPFTPGQSGHVDLGYSDYNMFDPVTLVMTYILPPDDVRGDCVSFMLSSVLPPRRTMTTITQTTAVITYTQEVISGPSRLVDVLAM